MKENLSESGFILIVVLIFIAILSEILLSMMNSIILTSKTIENMFTYSNYVYKTDIALEQARQAIFDTNRNCFEYWCSVEGDFLQDHEKLEYKINFLETIPCFQMKGSEKIGVDFFKVSVRLINHLDILNVESTFATVAASPVACSQQIKKIDWGWLSWRIIRDSQ